MKTKLKNLLTGYKTETVYGADDKLDDVILDRKEATLSFINGDEYTFMDTTDYTMYELNAEDIEAVLPYIEEGMEDVCEAVFFEGRLVSVELPTTISRKVVYTENAARGDTSGKVMKPAKLANGTEISVADFIQIDEWIDIDTRDNSFKGRSSNASCETQKPGASRVFCACVFPILSACLCSHRGSRKPLRLRRLRAGAHPHYRVWHWSTGTPGAPFPPALRHRPGAGPAG